MRGYLPQQAIYLFWQANIGGSQNGISHQMTAAFLVPSLVEVAAKNHPEIIFMVWASAPRIRLVCASWKYDR